MVFSVDEFGPILIKEDFSAILGQKSVKDQIKSTLLSGRHCILVGPPGAGKTTLAKSIASMLPPISVNDCGFHCSPENPVCPKCNSSSSSVKTISLSGSERFVRVQGSPDLTAEDLLGDIDPSLALKFGPLSVEAFTPGKIFRANNGVLFFDEINRCSDKLQNALLQVLEERKVTIGSYDVDFDANVLFIATMNPDDNSTEPLSDVFLDRFDIIKMGYPESDELEFTIMTTYGQNIVPVSKNIGNAIVSYVRSLRSDNRLEKVPSVRATLGLFDRAQSNAFLAGNSEVSFDDLGKAVDSVIAHRIRLKPSVQFLTSPEKFVKESFDKFLEDSENLVGDGP